MRATSRRSGALRRSTVPLILAVIAVMLAVGAGLAPARKLQTRYAWPPPDLPSAQPVRAWYTPLLLARHEPSAISARLPCGARPLPDAPRPLVLLSTTRDPEAANGLAVTERGRTLIVTIGGAALVHADLPGATTCDYSLRMGNGRWSLTGPGAARTGTLSMPTVEGLFSSVDLRAGPRPAVAVTSVVYATRSTLGQTLDRILAVLAALGALVLLVRRRETRPSRPKLELQPVDGVVVALLLLWWVIGPAYFDDGWIMAGQHNFLTTGNFSTYYDSFGVASSVQYWLAWLEHFVFEASNAQVVLRLPALVCLIATWIASRWILGRTAAAQSRAAVWALASAFSVGALAWGMTLRPEPIVALLVTGVVACVVRFLERGTTAPLAAAAVLVALAVTAHPAGLVALAPLVVVAPRLLEWVRPRLQIAATIVLSALALAVVLVLLGTDVVQFHATVSSLRAHGAENAGWRDELTRYGLLARPLYGAPLRREWVVLALLAVFAYLLRRRRQHLDVLLDLFAPALGVALLLLIITPAKIPWHFGALIGLAALAVAAETARLVEDARTTRGRHVRPFIVVTAAMAAAAWSWFPRNAWSDLDLRTLSWTLGVERHVTFAKLAGLVPLLVLGAFVLARRGRHAMAAAWRTASWTAPIVAAPLIAFTVLVLVADAKKTHSWTLTRQNLDALRNQLGCGLADDTLVPATSSMRPLPVIGTPQPSRARDLPGAPVDNLARFVIGPAPARSPWFRLAASGLMGFFVSSASAAADSLQLEWGRLSEGRVKLLGADGIANPLLGDPGPDLVSWRFFPAGSLPSRPADANAVRIALQTGTPPGGSIGLTPPVTYDDSSLARRLERSAPSLALPNLLTYFPCIDQPAIRATAPVPNLIVGPEGSLWPLGTGTSPFDGLPHLYNLVRLPLTDSPHPPHDVAVYEVDRRIPGGELAPPLSAAVG